MADGYPVGMHVRLMVPPDSADVIKEILGIPLDEELFIFGVIETEPERTKVRHKSNPHAKPKIKDMYVQMVSPYSGHWPYRAKGRQAAATLNEIRPSTKEIADEYSLVQ